MQSRSGQNCCWVSIVRLRPRVEGSSGGGAPGALGWESAACSQAAHSGLWIKPAKGFGALERLCRCRVDWGCVGPAAVRVLSHNTWSKKPSHTRATSRSKYNKGSVIMTASSYTEMKGDHLT